MSEVHGKNTYVAVSNLTVGSSASNDISQHVDNSTFPHTADIHDITTYGKDSHVKRGGLRNGTFQMGGVYSNLASGTPRVHFDGHEGDLFSLTRRVEGTGTGKPQQRFDAVLANYTETNPVADYVRWTSEWEVSDDIDRTTQ